MCRDKLVRRYVLTGKLVSMPHAALCVSRLPKNTVESKIVNVSMPHAALCVSRPFPRQCAASCITVSMPHAALYVSRLRKENNYVHQLFCFNAARSIVCVETGHYTLSQTEFVVSMPHAALYVSRHGAAKCLAFCENVSMPHAALYVSRPRRPLSGRRGRSGFNAARSIVCVETKEIFYERRVRAGFNAARSIVCVETLCPAALVPRGLRRHFGKTRFFAPFLASADELCPEKWGSHRRCPLCGAGCTVLERRNGGMRLCARAGALSISFSSYLMIAHASFFFNDVFASMQRGR